MATNTGVLQFWNPKKGFGFVHERTIKNGKVTLVSRFAHVTQIKSGEPVEGCVVRYNLASSSKADRPDVCIDIEFESSETPSVEKGASDGK
jgi:cold shock CspA family protein